MGSAMGFKVVCEADPGGNMYLHISEFLILFHPTPVHKKGGSKFQGRQEASKDAFDNDFRAWLRLDTLETFGAHIHQLLSMAQRSNWSNDLAHQIGTHPPITKYGTKKQLAK